MISGTVKYFNASKGYGFLARDDGGEDVFVHATSFEEWQPTYEIGAKVVFSVGPNRRTGRTMALNVRLV